MRRRPPRSTRTDTPFPYQTLFRSRDGDDVGIITVDGVGKTKRLANTARVGLRPCDVRGRVAAGAPCWLGTAQIVRDRDGLDAVRRADRKSTRLNSSH